MHIHHAAVWESAFSMSPRNSIVIQRLSSQQLLCSRSSYVIPSVPVLFPLVIGKDDVELDRSVYATCDWLSKGMREGFTIYIRMTRIWRKNWNPHPLFLLWDVAGWCVVKDGSIWLYNIDIVAGCHDALFWDHRLCDLFYLFFFIATRTCLEGADPILKSCTGP